MGFFPEKPDLSERNPHYLRTLSENGLYLRAHLFTKEYPRSQDCIRTSDDLKMRLEKPILFARADKDRFSDKLGFSEKKPTLSSDKVGGFFQKNLLYLRETHIL